MKIIRNVPKRPRGAALLMALVVVSLAAGIAGAIAWQASAWSGRLRGAADFAQARQTAAAGVDFARYVLAKDDPRVDHPGEAWAQSLPALPVDGGTLSGRVEDAQARFNLNNLVINGQASGADVAIFRRLLQLLQLPPQLADGVVAWIAGDAAAGGAYLALSPPYRAAGQPLASLDELARVQGFAPGMIDRLRPYAVALPERTTVNVNTAPDIVLSAVFDGLDLASAAAIVQARGRAPFASKSDFLAHLGGASGALHDADYDVASHYFTAVSAVRIGRTQLQERALLRRGGNGYPEIVRIDYED